MNTLLRLFRSIDRSVLDRSFVLAASVAASLLVCSCAVPTFSLKDHHAATVTHAGLFHDLNQGDYQGFMTISNLVEYGDHGLGTFDRLDGEMIVYSGVVYRAAVDGSLTPAALTNTTPFAVVTYFQPGVMFDIAQVDQPRFNRAMDMRRKVDGIPLAIQVHGLFSSVTIRSVPAQEPPWRPLGEVLKESQQVFTLTNVVGSLIGYQYPEHTGVLHPPGFHFHFVDAARERGGHVLDFSISQARILVDPSPVLHAILNTNRIHQPRPAKIVPSAVR